METLCDTGGTTSIGYITFDNPHVSVCLTILQNGSSKVHLWNDVYKALDKVPSRSLDNCDSVIADHQT